MTNKLKLVTTTIIEYEIEADNPLEALDKFSLIAESERRFFEATKPTTEVKILMELKPLECG